MLGLQGASGFVVVEECWSVGGAVESAVGGDDEAGGVDADEGDDFVGSGGDADLEDAAAFVALGGATVEVGAINVAVAGGDQAKGIASVGARRGVDVEDLISGAVGVDAE